MQKTLTYDVRSDGFESRRSLVTGAARALVYSSASRAENAGSIRVARSINDQEVDVKWSAHAGSRVLPEVTQEVDALSGETTFTRIRADQRRHECAKSKY